MADAKSEKVDLTAVIEAPPGVAPATVIEKMFQGEPHPPPSVELIENPEAGNPATVEASLPETVADPTPDEIALKARIAELEAQLAAKEAGSVPAEPIPLDLAEDADVKVTAQPDVNGYATVLSITGAGRGRHVGSLRLIGPGGHSNFVMDLDFNGPEFSTPVRSVVERGFLRLPGSCPDDLEVVILPKPFDEGI